MYVLISGAKFPVDTVKQLQAAIVAMRAMGVETVDALDDDGEPTGDRLDVDIDPKLLALADVLSASPLHISECRYGDNQFESSEDPGEYLVLTDSERTEAWEQSLDSYIDECILDGGEFPEAYKQYFDREAWKRDARHDGAGHSLASYDGEERGATIDGETYYVYRVN
jgi:hypothetical protein